MRPGINDLASRRPALAALIGSLPSDSFGGGATFGGEFGVDGEFGFEGQGVAAEEGDPMFGIPQFERGDLGVMDVNSDAFRNLVHGDMALRRDVHGLRRHLTEAQRKILQFEELQERRDHRAAQHAIALDPNRGQRLKLGRYSFGLSQAVTIGIAAALFMSDSPATTLRTKRVVINAPGVGFATVSTILIANVAVTVGGVEDAYAYSAQSFDVGVDYPTLPPSQKATFSGGYTGFAPAPLFNGQAFAMSVRFSGVSTIAGGA